MLLRKITLVDFGVYGGCNEFDLTVEPDKPIVLCGGKNGSGKTTLFESIPLCLYGQDSIEPRITQKQYNQKIMRLFHKNTSTANSADEASVSLEFQHAHDGIITEYKVIRSWQNIDGKVIENLRVDKKSGKKFVSLDATESDSQIFINQILPRGITRLFFFDGEKIQNLAESGTEDMYIKTSFNALLGLDLVTQLYDDVGLHILRNSGGETRKILEEIEQKTAEKQQCEKKLEDMQEKRIFLKAEIERMRSSVAIHEEKFLKHGGQFAKDRQDLVSAKTIAETELETIKYEIRSICEDTLPFCLVPEQMKQVYDEIEGDVQTTRASLKKGILEEAFSDLYQDLKSQISGYDIETKNSIIKQIKNITDKKLESLSVDQKTMFNLSLEDAGEMMKLIEDVERYDRSDMKKLSTNYKKVEKQLTAINSSLDLTPMQDEIGPLLSEITSANREIGEMERELHTLEDLEAQEKSMIIVLNSQIRKNLARKKTDKKMTAGLDIAPQVQSVLDEFANKLRHKKVHLLESNILDGIKKIIHKEDFATSISIDPETFAVTLYRGDIEVTRDMMSKGELQIYATAIIWGIAKTSGRPLPFIIDTPLARLDVEHRGNLLEQFYPHASHQMIILSTDSEIIKESYRMLEPHISKSLQIQYSKTNSRTIQVEGYFFDGGSKN